MVDTLEFAEDRLKSAMSPFLTQMFSQFYEQREIW
jgi:hypothetical protein